MDSLKHNAHLQNSTPISKILAQGGKLSLSGLTSCADALQHLKKNQAQTALVQNNLGHFIGVVTQKNLQSLGEDAQNTLVEAALESVGDICTPHCSIDHVYQRLEANASEYILVVNASGQLLGFLEPRDFRTIFADTTQR